ncbi:MAG: hypothetical protein Kow0080_14990 [Candidatus Promineifilaceae bacterium]
MANWPGNGGKVAVGVMVAVAGGTAVLVGRPLVGVGCPGLVSVAGGADVAVGRFRVGVSEGSAVTVNVGVMGRVTVGGSIGVAVMAAPPADPPLSSSKSK